MRDDTNDSIRYAPRGADMTLNSATTPIRGEGQHAKSAYNAEIEAIEAELQCQETSRTLFMNSLSRFRQLDTFVQRAEPKERKELVAELFDELHIDPDSATITDYTMKSWTQRLLR